MDALASLLEGPRARGAFLLRTLLAPPWALRVADQAPLTVLCVTRGEAWIVPEPEPGAGQGGGPGEGPDAAGGPARREAPQRLGPGDVALVRGPTPYVVADAPGTAPSATVLPGGCCVAPDGTDLCEALDLGLRTWGTVPPEGAGRETTELLVGTYQLRGEVTGGLTRALPRVLTLPAADWDRPLVPLLAAEITRDAPGQEAVLDRLLDLLVISVLRSWFARPQAAAPEWYRAHGDPVVGRALRLMHDLPAHPWTVASLAAKAGVSRAALARRFTTLVGEPPMTYLTNRRLDLAAELLREPETTLAGVARRVGYGSAFALSAAFKRERGVSPARHREGARPQG
ncbi:AraC family transcriptional regulator [Streptomyces hoynatensis]|uniref:AraC family transcriptional regulator n=1 Tax=Streptomyces hoynatensis TaxID=1141874 RepID=A0A3A9ZBM6_9ACTN|nr:AraC family transcriptional regulator [Streptomyces hoynatensis]RKN45721.1 AraC family transcriptional regulator [Streptomyces hoynatensis]